MYRGAGDRAPVPNRSPVDEFCFRDGETHAQHGPLGLPHRVPPLQELDITPIGRRGNRQTEVVDIGKREALGDLEVESGNINNKQQWGDRGALWSAHGDRGVYLRRPLVAESARPPR